jgi:hypothetical protein
VKYIVCTNPKSIYPKVKAHKYVDYKAANRQKKCLIPKICRKSLAIIGATLTAVFTFCRLSLSINSAVFGEGGYINQLCLHSCSRNCQKRVYPNFGKWSLEKLSVHLES